MPSFALPLCLTLLWQHGSKVFLFFYWMFNIYIKLLAFCYTPAAPMYEDVNTGDQVSPRACMSGLSALGWQIRQVRERR